MDNLTFKLNWDDDLILGYIGRTWFSIYLNKQKYYMHRRGYIE